MRKGDATVLTVKHKATNVDGRFKIRFKFIDEASIARKRVFLASNLLRFRIYFARSVVMFGNFKKMHCRFFRYFVSMQAQLNADS